MLDASYLFALNSPTDSNHENALKVARLRVERYVIPDIVLAETAYMLRTRVGLPAVLNFLDTLDSTPQMELESVSKPDVRRARQIMSDYDTLRLDLADCCIMAQSERWDIKHICTFDERDFRVFRPMHCEYLTLLPADLTDE